METESEVLISYIELWLKPEEVEIIHSVYTLLKELAPSNTQVLVSTLKRLKPGECKIGLSYPLDARKGSDYFVVDEVAVIADIVPEILMASLLDKAKRRQRQIKWQIMQARRREWLFGKGNARIDGTDTQTYSKKSVEAL